LNIHDAKVSLINQLWGFFGIFAAAAVTIVWSYSGDALERLKWVVGLTFGAFAIVNFFTIYFAGVALDEIRDVLEKKVPLRAKTGSHRICKRVVDSWPSWIYLGGHFFLDAIVVVVICFRCP
jgi:hypothetical protein